MFDRLKAYLARRVMLHYTPRVPLRYRLRNWAADNASDDTRDLVAHRFIELEQYGRVFHPQLPAIMDAATKGSPERVSTAWPVLTQLGHHRYPGLRSLPKVTPANLRRFSESPPARRAIAKVRDMIIPMRWKVQPKEHILQELAGNQGRLRTAVDLPAEHKWRVQAIQNALTKPNDDGDTWLTFLSSLIEDTLLGAGAAEIQPWAGNDDRPFMMWGVDGNSVRINVNWISDDAPDDIHQYRYSQALSYSGAIPTQDMIRFKDSELMYVRMNPRTNTPFGFGPMEAAFIAVNAFLGAMESRERKESNEIAELMISLGIRATPEEVDRFRSYWENYIEGYGKTPIIGGVEDPRILPLRVGHGVDLGWPEFILGIIAICFGLSRSSMGIERDVNRNTAQTQQTDEFFSAALPVIAVIEDALNHSIIDNMLAKQDPAWADYEIKCVIKQADEAKEAGVLQVYAANDILKIDELRERLGYPPLEDGKGDMTLTPYRAAFAQGMGMGLPGGNQAEERLANETTPTENLAPKRKETAVPNANTEPVSKPPGIKAQSNGHDREWGEMRQRLLHLIAARMPQEALALNVDDPITAQALQKELRRAERKQQAEVLN